MEKSRYNRVMNAFFIAIVGLTLFNLFQNMIWLSYVLAAAFLLFTALHIRDYNREKPKTKKAFVLTIIVLVNFLLANVVIVIGEYVSIF